MNAGILLVDKIPTIENYTKVGAFEIKVKHHSSVGATSDFCCSVKCVSEFSKIFDLI